MKKSVSVVLPCLNEEKGIGLCIKKIRRVFEKENISGEIVVSDSGSSDRSVEIASSLGARVIESRTGYGSAYIDAFKHINGDYVVFGDSDNSYDFMEIPRFLKTLERCDFVTGYRKYVKKGAMPSLHKYIGNPLFTFILRLLFRIDIKDSHCGFGAIKRSKLEKLNLKSRGMEFASEILIKAKKNNLEVEQIPIVYYPRRGESKLRSFRDGFRHMKLILKEFIMN